MSTRVEDRARQIYAYLTTPMNTPHRLADMCADLGIDPNATTRRAIRKAAEYAAEDGLCLPCAEPREGGPVYVVTDEAAAALDSTFWLAKIAVGVGVISDKQADWMQSTRLRGMSEADRAMFEAMEAMREQDRAHNASKAATLKALTAVRKAQTLAEKNA